MTPSGVSGFDRARESRGRFTRGGGRYVADLALDGALSVGFVRSSVARGRITSLDLQQVRAQPGIIAAYCGQELAGLAGPIPVRYGPGQVYEWNLLATDWVSFVGEPVALVVGEDRAAVEEAAELAVVEYEALAAITDPKAAVDSSELVRPEIGSNLVFSATLGRGDARSILNGSFLVVEREFHLGRQSACPLENRAVLAYEEPLTREIVVSCSTQIPHILSEAVALSLHRPASSVRVVLPDVGGGFGLKCQVAAEECLVAFVAQHLGRRAVWLEDRWENLVASNHAHDERLKLRVGFANSGAITALEGEVTVDVGAQSCYPLSFALEPSSTGTHLFGCYKMQAARISARGVATNKCPTGAYRGVGASVASFATERILDLAAEELGLGRLEIRRRNLLSLADMPYEHPIGGVVDTGDPLAVFERLIATSGLREEANALELPDGVGQFGGIGLAVFTEHSGPGSAVYRRRGVTEVPGYDAARVLLRDDGTFAAYISSADAGQRHVEICQRQVAAVLGVDSRLVEVIEGDTASCPKGTGTFASRFAVAQVSAALRAARRVADRLVRAAGAYFGCPVEEVSQAEGGFAHSASGRAVSLDQLARWLYYPEGARSEEILELPFEELGYWDGGPALPCGAVLAAVEIDPETMFPRVRKVVAVEECGKVLDRDAVVGQVRGGLVMGVGDALLEEHLYSEAGEILTSSFMDYLLPSFDDSFEAEIELFEEERLFTGRSESGAKGVGEAGTIGAVAAIGSAAADALWRRGASLDELPATPFRIFSSLAAASSRSVQEVADGQLE